MCAYRITDECIGCTLCAKNCPVMAISGEQKSKHEIDPSKCVECGLCGRLCAKGAIVDGNGEPCSRVPRAEWPKPYVNRAICAGCSVCVSNCPKNCLELSEIKQHGDIRVFAQLKADADCIGCGICSKACPIDAISMVKNGEEPEYKYFYEKVFLKLIFHS